MLKNLAFHTIFRSQSLRMNTKEKHPEGWRSVQNKKYPTEGSQDLTFSNWIVLVWCKDGKDHLKGHPRNTRSTRGCALRDANPWGSTYTTWWLHHDHQGSHFQRGLNNCICDGSREGEEEECGAAKNICEALMCQPGWSYTPYEIEKGNPSFQSCSVCDKWVLFMKTSKLAIPHLPQPLWQQKKRKKKKPRNWPVGPPGSQSRWKS